MTGFGVVSDPYLNCVDPKSTLRYIINIIEGIVIMRTNEERDPRNLKLPY